MLFNFLLLDKGSRCRKTCTLNTNRRTLGLPLTLEKYLLFAGPLGGPMVTEALKPKLQTVRKKSNERGTS